MINILLAKIYFEALVPSIPSWVFVIALVAFMTAFNLRSIKSVANFNTVIVVLQVVLIAAQDDHSEHDDDDQADKQAADAQVGLQCRSVRFRLQSRVPVRADETRSV